MRYAPDMGAGKTRGPSRVIGVPAQVLDSFQALLHEFRSLQQELGPWTVAFQEQHARKPRMADVERTGREFVAGACGSTCMCSSAFKGMHVSFM